MGIEGVYKKSTYDCSIRIFRHFFCIDTQHSSLYMWFPIVYSSFAWGASYRMTGECFRLNSGLEPVVVLVKVPF